MSQPTSFATMNLSTELTTVISELGFNTPTPIQSQCIPLLLLGKDLIGQSQTGSGKTAAFAIPILQNIDLARREGQALILCPTRELSQQVAREFRKLGRRLNGLQVLVLVGGEPGRAQTAALNKGVHIVVGTPGRVLDHIQRDHFDLAYIKTLVLDEADRMLDMGFEEEVDVILREVPGTRQTALFSATFPEGIEQLVRKHLHKPERVTILPDAAHAPTIEQIVYECDSQEKTTDLVRVLQQHPPRSALIFCNQKNTVDELGTVLEAAGAKVLNSFPGLTRYDPADPRCSRTTAASSARKPQQTRLCTGLGITARPKSSRRCAVHRPPGDASTNTSSLQSEVIIIEQSDSIPGKDDAS